MASLGSTPRLRTNCRLMLMREKAFQEEQRKRKMSSPRGLNSSRNHPSLNASINSNSSTTSNSSSSNNNNSIPFRGIITHNGNNLDSFSSTMGRHLEPILSDDYNALDSSHSPYSLTPSSMTTSISEFDALFEDINEIVGKETEHPATYANYSFLVDTNGDKTIKVEMPTKPPLKTSSSCPTIRASRLTLPAKLDPSDFPDVDAYKKEKHNIVEKKRRYKINDCIQELADLLPESYDVDLNMKKGYILEKSVEYIQELKKDIERKTELEQKHRDLEREHRHLQLELQALKRARDAAILQQQQQEQQQQQQQYLLVSPNFQQPQHRRISPQPHQIVLAISDNFVNTTSNNVANNLQNFNINPSIFINDFNISESDMLVHQEMVNTGNPPNNSSLVDTDFLMSNLQVSSELTDMDRQELNNFVNLDEFSNDDLMITDFTFHNANNQF